MTDPLDIFARAALPAHITLLRCRLALRRAERAAHKIGTVRA